VDVTGITPEYEQSLLEWRAHKDETLRAERGWLALEGLYWLEKGANTLGSAPNNSIILPVAAGRVGSLLIKDSQVIFTPAPGVTISIDGEPAGEMPLKADRSGEPSIISLDNLEMIVIQRGKKYGLRVWDKARQQRKAFPGRRWFPLNPNFICTARLIPQSGASRITIPDVTGMDQEMEVAGLLKFMLAGNKCSLLAIQEDEDLFIIFRDETSGKDTYPAGRYMYSKADAEGNVLLDFNRAYNPPCAFTEYATCPLPPPQNRLPLRIEAGELAPAREN
jgi:uncharacterized protein (DUF1684 family)